MAWLAAVSCNKCHISRVSGWVALCTVSGQLRPCTPIPAQQQQHWACAQQQLHAGSGVVLLRAHQQPSAIRSPGSWYKAGELRCHHNAAVLGASQQQLGGCSSCRGTLRGIAARLRSSRDILLRSHHNPSHCSCSTCQQHICTHQHAQHRQWRCQAGQRKAQSADKASSKAPLGPSACSSSITFICCCMVRGRATMRSGAAVLGCDSAHNRARLVYAQQSTRCCSWYALTGTASIHFSGRHHTNSCHELCCAVSHCVASCLEGCR